jgi:hypothetical protein
MLRYIKPAFLIVAVAALAWFAWQSRDLLLEILRDARPCYLFVSVLVWILMNLVAAAFASLVFRALGAPLTLPDAARIHVSNLPARYLPGGIWHTVGRAADYRAAGIGAKSISLFVLLENVLAVCVAFILSGVLLAVTRSNDDWTLVALTAAFGAGVVLLLLPLILSRVAKSSDQQPALPTLLSLVVLTIVSWSIAATAFVIYVSAFPGVAATPAPLEIAGGYLFSWGVGFIAIFAPQGIGVFEVVAADLLRGTAPLMGIAALLAGFRLVILAADALAWVGLQFLSGLAVGQRRDLLGDQSDQEDDH